jgi:hypothetical protein
VRPANAEAPSVEFGSVIFAANEGPDFGDTRQMGGVETADRTATDDANLLH